MKNSTEPNQQALQVCLPTITTEAHENFDVRPAEDFQKVIFEAVDEALTMLGKAAKQSVYVKLDKTYEITKQNIHVEIGKFAKALEELFGPAANLIEIETMKNLHEKIGPRFKYSPKRKNLTFADYLTATRTFLSLEACTKKPMPNKYYDYKFC